MSIFVGDGTTGVVARADRLGLPTGTTDPATAEAGDTYYNTDTSKIRVYDGTAWADLASGGGGVTGYTIDNSVRFDDASSSYLSRNFAAGDRKTWTLSFWIKFTGKSSNSGQTNLFGVTGADVFTTHRLFIDNTTGRLFFESASATVKLETQQVFRDYSAWYHIVLAFDTTQATPSNRQKLYVNGVEAPLATNLAPNQNIDYGVNGAVEHQLGRINFSPPRYSNVYIADVHFIDGSALAPTAFGEFDATTGVWNPIEYTGSYPGNSFHLPFSTNDTGEDTSGNNNDWNISENIAVLTGAYSSALTSATLKTVTAGFTKPFNVGRSEGVGGLTFTPPTPIQYTSLVEVYDNNNVTQSRVNSGSFVQHAANAWVTVASGSGTINSMFFQRTDNASFDAGFYAIRVDGRVLYDSNQSDFLKDSPTNGSQTDTGVGGEVVGNYATLNPIGGGGGTLANGNLEVSTTVEQASLGTLAMTSGKWYWEVTLTTSTNPRVGVFNISGSPSDTRLGATANGWALINSPSRVFYNGTTTSYGSFSGASGNIVMVAYDADLGRIWYGENGTWLASGNPVTNSNPSQTSVTGGAIVPASCSGTGSNVHNFNFGQRPFAYTAPSGFKALCTTNLPTPTILDGSDYMDVVLYEGNGSTQTISGLNFSPDFVWIKERNSAENHQLQDIVRGATNRLFSNLTAAESADASSLTSFNSDGFSLGLASNYNGLNDTYVAWTWDAGSSTVTNNDGSISSQVRANASAGFSIVTWTGTGSNSTVGHGLGTAPAMYIVKSRTSSLAWSVYHSALGANERLKLSGDTEAQASTTYWNNTAPTSTVFSVGTSPAENSSGADRVTYCFAPVAGYSAFGSYVGNVADGPFVYTGFRPRWIMIKRTDVSDDWQIRDTTLNTYNPMQKTLFANLPQEEVTLTDRDYDILSNGFKIRGTDIEINASGGTYIYAAFAENPFSIARAR